MCLQETKLKGITQGLLRSLSVGSFMDWVAVDAIGVSRGILTLWDSGMFQLVDSKTTRSLLSCKFRNLEDNYTWVFSGVYGPSITVEKEKLWEDLGAIRGLWGDPWCIGGDFNVIRFPGERNMESRIMGPMRRFSQIIDKLELKDLPLKGGSYTRKGGHNNHRMARLDKFLITNDWEDYFGGAFQSLLPRPTLDHFPI